MADNEGVRKTSDAIVVSMTPDVCKTPMGAAMVPVPYTIIGKFCDVAYERVDVRMTGMATTTEKTRITCVTGDEAGTGGGLVSGVTGKYCKPITYSSTVRCHGEYVLYHSSEMWMNCSSPEGIGNTKGQIVYVNSISTTMLTPEGGIAGDTNPPVKAETPEEKSLWQKASPWVHGTLDVIGLVPGLGEISDGVNALVYVGEGDHVGAGLSAAAMIPFVGWGATVGKVGRHVAKEIAEEGAERLLREGLEEGAERLVKEGAKPIVKEGSEELLEESVETVLRKELPPLDGVRIVKPPKNPYRRPKHDRKGFKEEIWEGAKGEDGNVSDPLTKQQMDPNAAWDKGHKPGYEFRKHQISAEKRGISRKEFLDEYFTPEHYRPELPSSNRSRLGEDMTDTYRGH